MAFNSQKVEQMVRARGIKAKDFFRIAYPDRSGNVSYGDISKNKNPGAEVVERIADLLQCSIDSLFDREPLGAGNQVTGDNNNVGNVQISSDPEVLMETIKYLRDIISRQDKTIDEQNKHIDQLIELAKH